MCGSATGSLEAVSYVNAMRRPDGIIISLPSTGKSFHSTCQCNEEYGVVQLTNPQNYNRYNMKLFESIILLILRILYDEKKRELSVSDEVIINMGDIHEKFLTLKIRDKMMDKTTLRNAISTMRRFQLVEVLDKELSNQDSRLIIYDSILMAVRVEDIRQAYEKLENYKKGGKINEETDESEAD